MRKTLLGGLSAIALSLTLMSCVNMDKVTENLKDEGFFIIKSNDDEFSVRSLETSLNTALIASDKEKRVDVKSLLIATKISDIAAVIEFDNSGDCKAVNELVYEGKLTGILEKYVKIDGKYLVAVTSENLFDLVF